jgi:energy-coupling factor transporter ATP-binding protein EcfA2
MLELTQVTKLYHEGQPNEVAAVRDVNLILHMRQGTVLEGPSGSGKTSLLTLIGCGLGLLITVAVRWAINVGHVSYVPPNSVSPVQLLIDLDPGRIIFTFVLMGVVGTLAALLPARRAARKPIIDALGHV